MKTRTKILIFVTIIAGVVAVQLFFPNNRNHLMQMELQIGQGVTFQFDANPSFHSNSSGFYFYVSHDGIRYQGSDGSIGWSWHFNIARPIVATHGGYIAISEENGRRIYVFHADGSGPPLFQQEFNYPIATFSINNAGFLAVVLRRGDNHYVEVYNQASVGDNGRVYRRLIAEPMAFVSAVEVSENGRFIAVALTDLHINFETTVQLGYIGIADARDIADAHGIFFAETIFNDFVHSMRFMADGNFVVATTAGVMCYRIVSSAYAPTLAYRVWDIEHSNLIDKFIFYGDRHFAYVTGARRVGIADATPAGIVRIYNINNTMTGEFNLGRPATHISAGHGALLIGAGRNFHAVSLNGNHLWEHNVLQDTHGRNVIFLDDTNTILVPGLNRADVHVRRRVRTSGTAE